MIKMKEILAAGIVQDLQFRSHYALGHYLNGLEQRKVEFKVLEILKREDGCVFCRIVKQYNNSPLIQLYEEG